MITGKLKLVVLSISSTALCLLALSIIHPPKAHAFIWPPGNLFVFRMPTPQYNYLDACDAGAYTPAFQQWISASGSPTATSVNVPYGTASIPLDFNWNGAVCRQSGGSAFRSNLAVISSPTPGVNNIVGAQMGLNFGVNAPVGTYSENHLTFGYAPPGGFTQSGNYTIALVTKSINQFPSGFICIENSPTPHTTNAINNFAPCNTNTVVMTIHINVLPRPPTGSISGPGTEVSCNQIVGYAFDPDRTSQSIYVDIWIYDARGNNGVRVAQHLLAGNPSPDVDGFFKITGNHRFGFNNYNNFRDAQAHVVRVYGYGINAAGQEDGANSLIGQAAYGPCYNASCALNVNGGAPVIAGKNFNVSVRFTNTGQYRWAPMDPPAGGFDPYGVRIGMPNVPPVSWGTLVSSNGYRVTSTNNRFALNGVVSPGQSITINFSAQAPKTLGSYTMSLQALIERSSTFAGFWFGQQCNQKVDVYQTFALVAKVDNVQATPSDENPAAYTFATEVDALWAPSGGVFGTNLTREFYWQRLVGGSYVKQGDLIPIISINNPHFNPLANNYTDNSGPPPSPQAGDQVCAVITVTPFTGLVDSTGHIINASGSNTGGPICVTIINEPYVSFYGNDVFAGGSFDHQGQGNCPNPSTASKILTYYNLPIFSGAGAQFAAFALGQIDGFASANLRGAAPAPATGLTFANAPPTTYGGNFGGTHCQQDFYGKGTGALSGPQTIAGMGIPNGTNQAIYVNGDALISGNIVFTGSGSYASAAQIPSFYLVVRGNIYIDHNVTQLDGVYVAEPINNKLDTQNNGGRIYTCVDGSKGPFTSSIYLNPADLYNNCQKQLLINGSFISQQTKLLRTANSLRNSKPGLAEYGNRKAGEIFEESPETYIAQQPPGLGSSTSVGSFDYVTSLPPVL